MFSKDGQLTELNGSRMTKPQFITMSLIATILIIFNGYCQDHFIILELKCVNMHIYCI